MNYLLLLPIIGFTDSPTEKQLAALIDDHRTDSTLLRWLSSLTFVLVATTAVYADSLHHFAETIFELLLR